MNCQREKQQRKEEKNQIKRKFQAIKACFWGPEVCATSQCELIWVVFSIWLWWDISLLKFGKARGETCIQILEPERLIWALWWQYLSTSAFIFKQMQITVLFPDETRRHRELGNLYWIYPYPTANLWQRQKISLKPTWPTKAFFSSVIYLSALSPGFWRFRQCM